MQSPTVAVKSSLDTDAENRNDGLPAARRRPDRAAVESERRRDN